ncbi:tyrosine-protein phosphatase-like protein non-receptor [Lentithecium fluviatile CBS 122367]|uniref:protein-tyrosine-phosphatase n=1 Tax=Lentithecium fluviatile CBS 122367 TaxID=1168545 RepID=A0A6G1J9A4_9PLEO|nr:tyrosine-protein phosphatase-like protein non-receptor [Lentithecium fluviatile CBS 122367]
MSTPAALSPRPCDTSHSTQTRSRPTPKTRPSAGLSPGAAAPLSARRMNEIKTPSLTHNNAPRTPSPNYFGLAVNANADVFASSAAQHIGGNWSPPSSNVRSTAALSPRVIPVDQNPEFEQFRRQSENSRGFALGKFDFGSSQASLPAPKGSVFGSSKPPLSPQSMTLPENAHEQPNDGKDEGSPGPEKPRSPKRLLSTESVILNDRPRRNSPASFLDQEGYGRTDEVAEFAESRNSRQSMPPKQSMHTLSLTHNRAQTLPAHVVDNSIMDGPSMVTPQHAVNILESAVEEVLLLDLRVSTQYARARIAGALSLCIPTTLLKRASFNVQKLAETFKDEEQRQKFESWRNSKHIIVYDATSSQLQDAITCVNTLKKFTTEGWKGGSYIIRGGFQEFANIFPTWVTHGSAQSSTSSASSIGIEAGLPSVAPVIGGCPMPATQNAANPFFGNIRQNMDLIGGVGQMPIKQPTAMTQSLREELPEWVQKAASEKDKGKLVSDKFLQIEKQEQKRMQEALSAKVVYGTPSAGPTPVKAITIAGIEKGSKNRYNSIWPYEHTRVKLQGVNAGGCDYVNANHIQASFSNKRYIATQGPLPATFNDFWNVVWQQDVRVIVMLTAEQEGGQLKAHNYWSSKQYGHLHLNALGERKASLEPTKIHRHREQRRPALGQRRSTNPPKPANLTKETAASSSSEQPYVTVRKFTLSNSDEPFERMREITQLQYSHWPDFGAPAHPTHLLGLIEQCDAVCRQVNGGSPSRPDPPNVRPVLVHCSAGCGRTGTFCTVDSVLDMLKRQRQARNVRQVTPMQLDLRSPDVKSQGSPMQTDDKPTPPRKTSDTKNLRDDGSWINSEDLDLIEKTVAEFRLQRLSMVQSLRQFVLCYESVLEWLLEQHPKSA